MADKLTGMCKTDKESYEKYWDDISPFIKFGCLKDEKFCDRMNDYILFKDINDKYMTLPELLKEKEEKEAEAKDENAEDKADNTDADKDTRETIYYVTDKNQQGQYIRMFKESDMNAVILDHNIDTSFITQLEQRNQHYKFMRIDADVTDALKEEVSEEDMKSALDTLTETFRTALGKENLDVKVEKIERRFYLIHDHTLRRGTSYAGYDEDVQYVRHGSVHVWRQ